MNARAPAERLTVIDRAIAIRGVGRIGFVPHSGEATVVEILVERPFAEAAAGDGFAAAFDAPVDLDPAVMARCVRTPRRDRQAPWSPRSRDVRRFSSGSPPEKGPAMAEPCRTTLHGCSIVVVLAANAANGRWRNSDKPVRRAGHVGRSRGPFRERMPGGLRFARLF